MMQRMMADLVRSHHQDGVAVLTIAHAAAGRGFCAATVGLPAVLRRVEGDRAGLGDHGKPAPLLARLAAEARGFHAATPSGGPS